MGKGFSYDAPTIGARWSAQANTTLCLCLLWMLLPGGESHAAAGIGMGGAGWINFLVAIGLAFFFVAALLGLILLLFHRTKVSRQTEERLRESEAQFRLLVENIPSAMYRCDDDEDWTMHYLSGRILDLTGYPASEFLGNAKRTFLSIIHPDDRERVAEAVDVGLDSEGFFVLEYRVLHADGSVRWFYEQGQGVYDATGKLCHLVGTITDVTEQKEVEEALRESSRKLRELLEERDLLLENLRDFVYRHDVEGVVQYVSPSVEHVLGYKVNELQIDYHELMTDNPVNTQAEQFIARALHTGEAQPSFLVELYHKAGYPVMLEVNERPVKIGDRVVGMVGVLRDVSDRIETERELMHLRSLLSSILDSMPSVLVAVDRAGAVTQWNSGAVRETGIEAYDAIGRSLSSVFPRLAGRQELIDKAIEENAVQYQSKVVYVQDGKTVYEDLTVYPLLSDGVQGAVIRADDITERVRIEEMMVQTEKMLSVGGLAAGMAHEINNPLGIIMQSAQNMERRLSLDLEKNVEVAKTYGIDLENMARYMADRRIDSYLKGIKDAGQRAARIVHNMLDFSRKSESAFAPSDVNDLIEGVIELASSDYDLKKRYDFKRINIVREYAENLPPLICTRTEIEQVILNLLKNATQAMAEVADEERTEPPQITIRTTIEDEFLRIEVSDNGPGLDEDTRRRVFEPFFTTKAPGIGTGLGLSVSYFIITQNHGGMFSVHSEKGKGATFIIRLPYRIR